MYFMKKIIAIFLLLFIFSGNPGINYNENIKPVIVFISEDYNRKKRRNRYTKHRGYRIRILYWNEIEYCCNNWKTKRWEIYSF